VQNKCLRTITGAFKTTNAQVLEHEASVAPLDLYLETLATNHVLRTEDFAGLVVAMWGIIFFHDHLRDNKSVYWDLTECR
jgi:hypothetical protein